MAKNVMKSREKLMMLLWTGAGVLFLALLFVRIVYPELLFVTILIGTLLLGDLGALVVQNQKALRTRSAAYGLNSAVTVVLVIAILGVLNFLASRYPLKLDLTKNKVHTLSDQTIKLMKGLEKPLKITVFTAQRDKHRPLMDNYKSLTTKIDVEYVDLFREPTRVKAAGIRKPDTIVLNIGTREDKIEDVSEEKITNALIKLLKDKSPVFCAITGHGEKSFSSAEAEGYEGVKKALANQYYEVKEVNLGQEGKIPETCDGVAIIGPTKAFFEQEVKVIKTYLENGGRAIIAVDLNLKGGDYSPELNGLLKEWHIKPVTALIVDPVSRIFGMDMSVAIVASYSKDHAITRDFQANSAFPMAQPLEIIPGAQAGLNVQWIAQTTNKATGVTDLSQIQKGEVKLQPGRDKPGPLNVAIMAEGKQKDSKATKNTRLVVFGSSHFATNHFSRFAGNLDFFLNSVSWILEDESLISIRSKDATAGKIEMSQKTASFVLLITIVVIPLLIAAAGIGFWIHRRKL